MCVNGKGREWISDGVNLNLDRPPPPPPPQYLTAYITVLNLHYCIPLISTSLLKKENGFKEEFHYPSRGKIAVKCSKGKIRKIRNSKYIF